MDDSNPSFQHQLWKTENDHRMYVDLFVTLRAAFRQRVADNMNNAQNLLIEKNNEESGKLHQLGDQLIAERKWREAAELYNRW